MKRFHIRLRTKIVWRLLWQPNRGDIWIMMFSRKKIADLRTGRPDAAVWIYPTEVVTALHVFGPTPATTQAYQWLGDDLNRIGWLDHFLRRRL